MDVLVLDDSNDTLQNVSIDIIQNSDTSILLNQTLDVIHENEEEKVNNENGIRGKEVDETLSGTRNNPLVFNRMGDYKNNHQLLCKDYSKESQRILSIYLGLLTLKNVKLDWQVATAKEGISVYNCDIASTAFKALKSTCVIKGKKEDILKLLTNVEKSIQYDESMEGVEVRKYYYYTLL